MGSPTQPAVFVILTFVVLSEAQTLPRTPNAFVFPLQKDAATAQYYTAISVGAGAGTLLNVVVDLGGKFLYFNSLNYFNASSTYRAIECGTPACRLADGVGCTFCFLSPPVPGCTNNTCSDDSLNPFTGMEGYAGLGQDTLHVYSAQGKLYTLTDFPFQFSQPALLEGLAAPTVGVIGLGRARISLPAQLASAFKIRKKIVLCIAPFGSQGNMIIGQDDYAGVFQNISRSLTRRPMIRNPVSTDQNEVIGNLTNEYFLDVRSIRVGNKALSFNKTLLSIDRRTGAGGTSIRTVRHYTSLHRSIYNSLINEFVRASAAKHIRRVASVAPFGACFDAKTIRSSNLRPDVPTIDLVLQTTSVYWRFYGSNSMVLINNDVMCLGFVEGTPNLQDRQPRWL